MVIVIPWEEISAEAYRIFLAGKAPREFRAIFEALELTL